MLHELIVVAKIMILVIPSDTLCDKDNSIRDNHYQCATVSLYVSSMSSLTLNPTFPSSHSWSEYIYNVIMHGDRSVARSEQEIKWRIGMAKSACISKVQKHTASLSWVDNYVYS